MTIFDKLLQALAQEENPESKLDSVINQLSHDIGMIRDKAREAVSSNDQHDLSAVFNQINTYARVLEWATSPGVDWATDAPDLGTIPGQPSF